MEYLHFLIDFVLHIDKHLDQIFLQYGAWSYAILFLIIFCETGLVITPFLPGDSLLFATGALSARGSLDVHLLAVLLTIAAIVGDAVNYSIGYYFGHKLVGSRFIKRQHIERTHRFYEKYGGKTIIIARFVPIVRTFAPFLAGMGEMTYRKFALYNVTGGVLWILSFLYLGYFFGSHPVVKSNFTLVILGIIVVSLLPPLIEVARAMRESRQQSEQPR